MREYIFQRLGGRIRYSVAGQIDRLIRNVIQLDPVAVCTVRTHDRGCVGSHEFVDENADVFIGHGGNRFKKLLLPCAVIGLTWAGIHFLKFSGSVPRKGLAGRNRFQLDLLYDRSGLGRKRHNIRRGQFKGSVHRSAAWITGAINDQIPVRLDSCTHRNRPFDGSEFVIRKTEPTDFNRVSGCIVKFDPVRKITRLIRNSTGIAHHDFADRDTVRNRLGRCTSSSRQVNDQSNDANHTQSNDPNSI